MKNTLRGNPLFKQINNSLLSEQYISESEFTEVLNKVNEQVADMHNVNTQIDTRIDELTNVKEPAYMQRLVNSLAGEMQTLDSIKNSIIDMNAQFVSDKQYIVKSKELFVKRTDEAVKARLDNIIHLNKRETLRPIEISKNIDLHLVGNQYKKVRAPRLQSSEFNVPVYVKGGSATKIAAFRPEVIEHENINIVNRTLGALCYDISINGDKLTMGGTVISSLEDDKMIVSLNTEFILSQLLNIKLIHTVDANGLVEVYLWNFGDGNIPEDIDVESDDNHLSYGIKYGVNLDVFIKPQIGQLRWLSETISSHNTLANTLYRNGRVVVGVDCLCDNGFESGPRSQSFTIDETDLILMSNYYTPKVYNRYNITSDSLVPITDVKLYNIKLKPDETNEDIVGSSCCRKGFVDNNPDDTDADTDFVDMNIMDVFKETPLPSGKALMCMGYIVLNNVITPIKTVMFNDKQLFLGFDPSVVLPSDKIIDVEPPVEEIAITNPLRFPGVIFEKDSHTPLVGMIGNIKVNNANVLKCIQVEIGDDYKESWKTNSNPFKFQYMNITVIVDKVDLNPSKVLGDNVESINLGGLK